MGYTMPQQQQMPYYQQRIQEQPVQYQIPADRSQYALSMERTEGGNLNPYPYLQTQPTPSQYENIQNPYAEPSAAPGQSRVVPARNVGVSPAPGVTINRSAVNPYGVS